MAVVLTRVLEIVKGVAEDLRWAGHVRKIELGVQYHKHFNGLIRHRGGLVCSHRDGIEWVSGGKSWVRRECASVI